jgi:hypothetical protein
VLQVNDPSVHVFSERLRVPELASRQLLLAEIRPFLCSHAGGRTARVEAGIKQQVLEGEEPARAHQHVREVALILLVDELIFDAAAH